MNTPTKSGGDRSRTPGATTPFRERAIEERRLKDELLLSATPGLKRLSDPQSDHGMVTNNPEDVKSYLRDLSAVLALQDRKNLTQVLANEEELPSDETSEYAGEEQETVDESRNDLRGSVFSQLKLGEHRLKVRRILEPIVIEDTDITQENYGNAVEVIDEPEPEPADVETQESSSPGGPVVDEVIPEELDQPEPIVIDESSFTDSEPEDVEPLPKFQMKQCLRSFIDTEGIELKTLSWAALQKASETLLKGMAAELLDEDKRIVPDRQNILHAFEKFKVVPKNSTNEALFEICCKYLTLEDLNDLEAALFL